MADCSLTVYSQNVNGLADNTKRVAVFNKLKRKGQAIFLLQETHSTSLMERNWKRDWGGGDIVFSHGTSNSRGVAILFSEEYTGKIVKKYCDGDGRFIILDILLDNTIYTIANLYAPTRGFEKEQITVFRSLCSALNDFSLENVLLGGDFNLYLNPRLDKLDSMPETNDNPNYRAEVLSLLESSGYIDLWRTLNPHARIFTWCRGKAKSRLDYFITSEHFLNTFSEVTILPGIHSDHSLLKFSLNSSASKHKPGRGFWKFNVSLLHDDNYVKEIKNIIASSSEKYDYIEDRRVVWELIKLEIRTFTVHYSVKKKRETNRLEKELNDRYTELHGSVHTGEVSEDIMCEYKNIKSELELIEKHKARGIIMRSKCQWTEEGEKNTSYFLRLEKQNFCNKLITQLNVDGDIIRDPKQILSAQKNYYNDLYTENIKQDDIFIENVEMFTDHPLVPKITEEHKHKCEQSISESEVLKSLKHMKNGRSPGSDGLSAEFYKFFWQDLKTDLLSCINYSLKHGELSIEQKRGIITLIPKKDKDRLFLKNWRPISLLNVDYKLIAKSLSNRLTEILQYIIDEDQTGYIKGRFIGCNIRIIEDLIIFTEKNNIPGIIMTIDFEKAFDSMNWQFIDYTLEAFNFGPQYRSYIKTLYN